MCRRARVTARLGPPAACSESANRHKSTLSRDNEQVGHHHLGCLDCRMAEPVSF